MWKRDILRHKKKTLRWYEREFELQTDYKPSQYTYNKSYFRVIYKSYQNNTLSKKKYSGEEADFVRVLSQ